MNAWEASRLFMTNLNMPSANYTRKLIIDLYKYNFLFSVTPSR
jgi:hypothetical protein